MIEIFGRKPAKSIILQLMNKNTVVAEYDTSTETEVVYRQELLPFDYKSFEHYYDERIHSACWRMNLGRLFDILSISCKVDLFSLHFTSLTDTYWLRIKGDAANWETVSPYINAFDDCIKHFAVTEKWHPELKTSAITAELTLNGSFKKCWTVHDNEIILRKYGSTLGYNSGNEPYSEMLCSQLSQALHFEHYTPYTVGTEDNNTVFSDCPLFTSEQVGLVDIDTLANDKGLKLDTYMEMYEWLKSLNLPYIEQDFTEMMLLDALTCNVDRHMGNIGVLYDTYTKQLLRMAPIYDNNFALFPLWDNNSEALAQYLKRHNIGTDACDIVSRFNDDFVTLGKSFLTSDLKERLELLINDIFHFEPTGAVNFDTQRLEVLSSFVRNQASKILNP